MNPPPLTEQRLAQLLEVGVALSAEQDTDRLLERILSGARELTEADAGTIYRVHEGQLHFDTVHNDTLGLHLGGTSGVPIDFSPLPLYLADDTPNTRNVAAYAAVSGETVRIDDAYHAEGFDFSGTRAVDARTGYRSQSFLTVPLRDHEQTIIGVLQLINAVREGQTVPFTGRDARIAESLASQAAIALTKQGLIDTQRQLFESFTEVLARAIDRKNPTTGRHCERVPQLTLMIADAACRTGEGALADYRLSAEEHEELRLAAWLHDCGKVTTPEAVVNKATKLERQTDRIEEVATRAAVVRQEAEAERLRRRLAAREQGVDRDAEQADADYRALVQRLDDDLAFLRSANIGGEAMDDEACERVAAIARTYSWTDAAGERRPLLSAEEVEHLQIRRGTLSAAEMEQMRDHVRVSREMLEQLTYPRHLQRVPEIASQHHERMDGGGYPDGITGGQMCRRARMMALADVFEALTAADRPYKPGKKLSEAVRIMGFMTQDGHFDPELFDLFIREGVYLDYARQFMHPSAIDAVDETAIPGYRP
nr:HD family phosphohydrolase [Halorhodospira halophila]